MNPLGPTAALGSPGREDLCSILSPRKLYNYDQFRSVLLPTEEKQIKILKF